jgi:hypothetical protein
MVKLKFLILPGLELQPLGLSAREQSLYRLSYRDSHTALTYLLRGLNPQANLTDRAIAACRRS